MIKSYKHIVILTGAGISAESGIATFRASDGLWEERRVEDVATPEGFFRDPAFVQQFYNDLRRKLLLPEIMPNLAHIALATLQKTYSGAVTLITQNIDNLHERAGSQNVLHMHGELLVVRCLKSGRCYDWLDDVKPTDLCECCITPQVLRPHIVWFGEMPLLLDEIYQALADADLFVAIGTSGHVYPAAGFVAEAQARGIDTLEINLEPSKNKSLFLQHRYGSATQEVSKWVDQMLGISQK